MKIIKLIPRGFCKGVTLAIQALENTIINNPSKNIYSLGWIIHNQDVIDDFISKGVIFLDDTKKSRYELINELNDPNAIVVFSAHGTSEEVFELAKRKQINFIDVTCEYVSIIHKIIKDKIKDNEIIYLGKKNHPETIATLSISNKIIFIDLDESRNNQIYKQIKIDKSKNYYLLNQTTTSLYDYYEIVKFFKENYTNIIFDNEICNATTKRQEAVINMPDDVDILIVVGDKKSNNSNQLKYIGEHKHIASYLVNNANDLDINWFKNKNKVAITAGTSSPSNKINEVIMQIKGWFNDESKT